MTKQAVMFRDIQGNPRTREAHHKIESALQTLLDDMQRNVQNKPELEYKLNPKGMESLIPHALGRIPTHFADNGYEVSVRYEPARNEYIIKLKKTSKKNKMNLSELTKTLIKVIDKQQESGRKPPFFYIIHRRECSPKEIDNARRNLCDKGYSVIIKKNNSQYEVHATPKK